MKTREVPAGWGTAAAATAGGPAGGPVQRQLPPGAAVELSGVSRWYGNVVAVNDISMLANVRMTVF